MSIGDDDVHVSLKGHRRTAEVAAAPLFLLGVVTIMVASIIGRIGSVWAKKTTEYKHSKTCRQMVLLLCLLRFFCADACVGVGDFNVQLLGTFQNFLALANADIVRNLSSVGAIM